MAGGNQLFTNYDYSKVFIWNKRFRDIVYTNSTGATVNLAVGTLMGAVLATGKALPHISSASDGSEMPVGFCGANYSVDNGVTVTIKLCISGDVAQDKITLGAGDTLNTPVRTVTTGGGTIENLIYRNTGCILVPGTDQTYLDNQ